MLLVCCDRPPVWRDHYIGPYVIGLLCQTTCLKRQFSWAICYWSVVADHLSRVAIILVHLYIVSDHLSLKTTPLVHMLLIGLLWQTTCREDHSLGPYVIGLLWQTTCLERPLSWSICYWPGVADHLSRETDILVHM